MLSQEAWVGCISGILACQGADTDLRMNRLGQILVYAKIRQAMGIKDTVISGGGSLAAHLDDFFEVLGLEVINGWGLTEVRTPCL